MKTTLSQLGLKAVKVTPALKREWAEQDRRELAAALLRRHEARKVRRARAAKTEWMKFAADLWAL